MNKHFQNKDSLNRYLLCFLFNEKINADVLSFTATEHLSKPYKYMIKFTCQDKSIPIEQVLNTNASFLFRAPNIHAFLESDQKWLEMKQVNGVITSFSRIDSSSDEALYECVLENELALLDKTRKSAVYLGISVPELVKKVMLEHKQIQSYKIDFETLQSTYPSRAMVIQWQETDLQFILRLLCEVGIWFHFENHPKITTETLIIFSDSGTGYQFSDKKIPFVRNSGMTNEKEYITDLREFYNVVSDAVKTRNYNYRDPSSPQADKSVYVHNVSESVRAGQEYRYGDNQLTSGDYYGTEGESASFYARVRHEYLLNHQSIFTAVTNDPQISPGVMFYPTGNVPEGFKRGFVVCQIEISGSRAEHFTSTLSGIPYSEVYCFRPERIPRPVISGTVPARVSARTRNALYAETDVQGRYIVKFDFDVDEKKKGYESAFVRLGRPYAGDTFGFHFPLLDNTEVAVAFELGDPDRPFISHVLHDGANPDLVTIKNDTRNIIRTASFNKIRLEDKRGQEHIKLSTEYGKTQLNTGHLVDAERQKRGEGFELRTDKWGTIRSAKGLMLTTEPQPGAQGKQLDMTAAISALQSALALARTLQQTATTAGAGAVDTGAQQQLSKALNQLTSSSLLAYSGQGQAFITPSALQLSAGEDLIATAGSNASLNIVKKFSLAVGEKLSLFAQKLGIQLIAAAGNVEAQAQRGEMHLLSQQDFTLSSTDGKMTASAKKGIQFSCGGGGIRINADGSVEIFSPTGIELKGPNLAFMGPERVTTTAPVFEKGTFKRRFKLHSSDDPDQPVSHQKFRLTGTDGTVTEGMTDGEGHSSLLDADDIHMFKMEILHD
ncbi:type VI secretion system tip protein VgrG [Rahnella sp. L72c]|uniref:Type VI secretion system tip protein VgrG n=1 Tax=Rahnella perminowiae TaxID=2816244 RepID=A0ABS6KXU6_9GAMM|nr:type VI secretion system tip protein VgrG [Rahnella perminowiae]MBU9834296.1 type VI secretion system tip protein VgrG [Rahnella perminowiae]